MIAAGAAAMAACLAFAGCQKKDAPQGPPPVKSVVTKGGAEMVLVPAGDFLMGDDQGEEDAKPARRVHLDGFCIDRREVTQKSYEGLMGTDPSKFKGPERPVERVSFLSAARYCNMRSLKEGLTPCYDLETLACDFEADGYRLPTEAEWEYACRAGTGTAYSFGGDAARLRDFGWSRTDSGEATHPVAGKKPNPWGLYDMHGNVSEWCNDRYDERAYPSGEAINPRGPPAGQKRVLRGGNWRSEPDRCRSAARFAEAPGFADVCFGYEAYGFRCVKKAPPDSSP